jgi:hypothetical protein
MIISFQVHPGASIMLISSLRNSILLFVWPLELRLQSSPARYAIIILQSLLTLLCETKHQARLKHERHRSFPHLGWLQFCFGGCLMCLGIWTMATHHIVKTGASWCESTSGLAVILALSFVRHWLKIN